MSGIQEQDIIETVVEAMGELKVGGLTVRHLDVEVEHEGGGLFVVSVRRTLDPKDPKSMDLYSNVEPEHTGYTVQVQPIPDRRQSVSKTIPL